MAMGSSSIGKRVRISVYWPDDWKEIVLSPEESAAIVSGKEFYTEGEGYRYEGEEVLDSWHFAGGLNGNLVVGYGDGGEGFIGKLSEAEIEELEDAEK